MNEIRLRRIQRVSRYLKYTAFLVVVAFAVFYCVAFFVPEGAANVVRMVSGQVDAPALSAGELAVVFLFGAVPLVLFLVAVFNAGRLFAAFQHGTVLHQRTGQLLGQIGAFILFSELAGILARAAASSFVSARAGSPAVSITLSSTNVAAMLYAGLIIVIGWVIAEAADMADDHRQIV
ncbi:MAG: hypothetical protein AAF615_08305 [Pseudomonadota bacterium]